MSAERRYVVPDPIAGTIELPTWLVKIKDEPAIRRMSFIRQLGLKAYVDYPGAIHTRYSHSLGTMYLASKLTDLLIQKMNDRGKRILADNLNTNRSNIMAAGFLHDIAHGPFSHSVDFALKKITGKTHQDLAEDVVKNHLPPDLDNWVNRDQLVKIIRGIHDYPFISEIIDGPIDVDKLDYLLRDAYHVGLRYSFDLDHFLRSHTILGDEENLRTCKLGLENNQQSIVVTELFLVVWKSMYDIVYHIRDSRIAEKMLEKAILINKDNESIRKLFTDINYFLDLDDEKLLSSLSNAGEISKNIVKSIRENKIFKVILEVDLNQEIFEMSPEFITSLKDEDEVCDHISKIINDTYKQENYNYICDIITSKSPKEIHINEKDEETGDYVILRNKSSIVGAIQALRRMLIYANPSLENIPEKESIFKSVKEIIEGL